MALDFLDGRVARRTGTSSAFGARFDMELDAFLLMALSVLVWQSGKAGAWVMGIGALRYVFVGTAYLWAPLNGELPDSFRRKAVCVVQGFSLMLCLLPFVPVVLATGPLQFRSLRSSARLDGCAVVGGAAGAGGAVASYQFACSRCSDEAPPVGAVLRPRMLIFGPADSVSRARLRG